MEFVRSRFSQSEEVVLRRDKKFMSFHVTGRGSKTLPKGTLVKVDRVEQIHDDHGRFCRFWYHLKHGLLWTSLAEEDDIGKSGLLDRLADIL